MSISPGLTTLLRLRELRAEERERALARTLGELHAHRIALGERERDLQSSARARAAAFAAAPLPAMHLHTAVAAEQQTRTRIAAHREQLRALEQQREQQAAQLQSAARERDLLGEMVARLRAEEQRLQTRREDQAATESFLARYGRRQ